MEYDIDIVLTHTVKTGMGFDISYTEGSRAVCLFSGSDNVWIEIRDFKLLREALNKIENVVNKFKDQVDKVKTEFAEKKEQEEHEELVKVVEKAREEALAVKKHKEQLRESGWFFKNNKGK